MYSVVAVSSRTMSLPVERGCVPGRPAIGPPLAAERPLLLPPLNSSEDCFVQLCPPSADRKKPESVAAYTRSGNFVECTMEAICFSPEKRPPVELRHVLA